MWKQNVFFQQKVLLNHDNKNELFEEEFRCWHFCVLFIFSLCSARDVKDSTWCVRWLIISVVCRGSALNTGHKLNVHYKEQGSTSRELPAYFTCTVGDPLFQLRAKNGQLFRLISISSETTNRTGWHFASAQWTTNNKFSFHRHSRWLYIQQQSSSSSSNRFIVFNKMITGRRRTLLLNKFSSPQLPIFKFSSFTASTRIIHNCRRTARLFSEIIKQIKEEKENTHT